MPVALKHWTTGVGKLDEPVYSSNLVTDSNNLHNDSQVFKELVRSGGKSEFEPRDR